MTEPSDYEVGYRKPPKANRFQKGAPSPNPKGRPKNEASLIRALEECMAENVNVTAADGTRTKMPAVKVIGKTIIRQAVSGSVPTQRMLLDIERRKTRPDEVPSAQEIEASAAATEKANELARKLCLQLHQGRSAEQTCFFRQKEDHEYEPSDIGRPFIDLHQALIYSQIRDRTEFKERLSIALDEMKRAMCEDAYEHLMRWDRGLKKSDLY